MKISFIVIFLLLFFLPKTLIGQNNLSGYIKDTQNEPLMFSNIIASSKSNKMSFFAISDEKGFYELKNLPNDTLLIEVSAMGFSRKFQKLYVIKSDTLNFTLSTATIELSEAIVAVKKDVRQSKDTISYNASSFSDSTEHNLEELLEKLPGFSVEKEKGTITVNGKSIKKIYIDGEEISGNNYQLITKNMPSDVVDKIQVLSNFNENALLKNISESSDVVLNLTINQSKKNIIFGNTVLGIGNQKNVDTYTNLFFLGNKFKVLNFLGYNNIGKYSLANRLMEDEPFGADEINFNQNISNQLRTINNSDINGFSDLSSQSIVENNEFSVSNQFSTKPKKNLKINGGVYFLNDKNNLSVERNTTFGFDSTSFVLQENIIYSKKPTTLDTHFGLDWQLNKSSAIHVASSFFKRNVSNLNETSSNFNSFQNNAQQNLLRLGTILTYTKRINEKTGVLISLHNENKANGEQSTLMLGNSFSVPVIGTLKNFVLQDIQQKIKFFNSKATYFYSFDKGKIATGIGFTVRNDKLFTEMTSESVIRANNILYLKTHYFFSFLNFNCQFRLFDFFINNEIGKISTNAEITDKEVFFQPTIGLKKEGLKNFFLLSYKAAINVPSIYSLAGNLITTGSRSFEQGLSQNYAIGESKKIFLNYRYTDFQNKFLSNFNLMYSISDRGYIQDFVFDNNYVIASKILNTKSARNIQVATGNEYYFDRLRLKLKFKPSIFYSEYYTSINTLLTPYELKTVASELSVRSAFKTLNYFGGVSISQSNIYNKFSFQKNTIEKGNIFLDFYFRKQQLNARFQNEILFVQNKNNLNKFLTSNLSVAYSAKKKPLKLEFTSRNIFNSNYFINASNSDYSSDFQSVRVIPRYFMLTMNYNFGEKRDVD